MGVDVLTWCSRAPPSIRAAAQCKLPRCQEHTCGMRYRRSISRLSTRGPDHYTNRPFLRRTCRISRLRNTLPPSIRDRARCRSLSFLPCKLNRYSSRSILRRSTQDRRRRRTPRCPRCTDHRNSIRSTSPPSIRGRPPNRSQMYRGRNVRSPSEHSILRRSTRDRHRCTNPTCHPYRPNMRA
jgi:hypothetical protein